MKNKGFLFFIEYFLNIFITILLPIYIYNSNTEKEQPKHRFILVIIIYTYIHILLELSGINSYLYLNNEFNEDNEKKINMYELSKNILAIMSLIIIIIIVLFMFYTMCNKYIFKKDFKYFYLFTFFIIFISIIVYFINLYLRDGFNTKNIKISTIILNIIKIIMIYVMIHSVYIDMLLF